MNLYDQSLQVLNQKPTWADGETVSLWQNRDRDKTAYLRRSGRFVHLCIAANGDELPDPFTVGEVAHEGAAAEPFILNHEGIYAAWAVRLAQLLTVKQTIKNGFIHEGVVQ